jgi:hypothetical protein
MPAFGMMLKKHKWLVKGMVYLWFSTLMQIHLYNIYIYNIDYHRFIYQYHRH